MTDSPLPSRDEAQLRAVLNGAVDGIITISQRGLIESVNPAAEQLFGYRFDEMVGQNVKMLMPSPYREEHDGYLKNYLSTGDRKIIGIGREVVGQRKDGSTFPMYLAVSEAEFDGERFFTGIVHNLADLKRAEDEATRLGRALDESLNEIYMFDAETMQFVHANRGARANLGYSMDEIATLAPTDLYPNYTVEQFEKLIAPLRTGAQDVVQLETVHKRKDGSTYEVEIRLQLSESHGQAAFVAVVLDVTDRNETQATLADLNTRMTRLNKELEERVEQRTQQLKEAQAQLVRREKLATLGQLAGGVAHEIRNPLGVIRNSVYFLKMIIDQLDDDGKECVQEIEREVQTANRIVAELLDFTRDPISQSEIFSLKEAINCTLKSVQAPGNVKVSTDGLPETSAAVNADRGQIERVLTNLVRNAIQAMPGGGNLSVKVNADQQSVSVQVQDSGVGIAAEDLDLVFEPLYTTKAKGIGLGLAVSRRYAERNGGTLSVVSEPGEGTMFTLSLPVCKTADELKAE
ncbi:MAG: PAS domain S-box protein [Planctomycetaceae bacterium]